MNDTIGKNTSTGYYNTGDYNTGSRNTGIFNTDEPYMRAFNKPTNIKYSDLDTSKWPKFIFELSLTEWIPSNNMTEDEKKAYPSYKTTGGYLKIYSYNDAWEKAWDNADLEDRKKVFNLPNFDNDIFLEITGINVEKELHREKRLDKDTIRKKIAELQTLLGE